jgi:hypothetical protein
MKSHYIVPLLIAVTWAATPFRKYSCHTQTAGLGLVPENDLLVTDHNKIELSIELYKITLPR